PRSWPLISARKLTMSIRATGTTRKTASRIAGGLSSAQNELRRGFGRRRGPPGRGTGSALAVTSRGRRRDGERLPAGSLRGLHLGPHGRPRVALLRGQVRREVRVLEDRRVV